MEEFRLFVQLTSKILFGIIFIFVAAIIQSEFLAPNSVVIGDVTAKEGSSIWYGATLRGEIGPISIGK